MIIGQSLQAAHIVLQTMSSESTPVLCGAIASFELLMTTWEKLGATYSEVKHWTDIGLFWARKYYKRMDDTHAYIITLGRFPDLPGSGQLLNRFIVLDPATRFSWIQREWEKKYIDLARKVMFDLVIFTCRL
jgi:hypothetical protein